LKPGGAFCLSVAAFAPRFVDEEHWRFTPAGLRSILSGFDKIEIIPELSSIGGLLRSINLGANSFSNKNRVIFKFYQVTLCPAVNLLGLACERLKLATNDQFAPNSSVRSVRKVRDQLFEGKCRSDGIAEAACQTHIVEHTDT